MMDMPLMLRRIVLHFHLSDYVLWLAIREENNE